ncbi:class I SAM-dependent methyltransferase [Psychroflexus maritimus]|nr:SAM-dependent methyltransferase [Psychroflexus maritimus]
MTKSNTQIFWEKKYKKQDIGWDIGQVSPPLKAFFDGLTDKNQQILIPGAGNAHEAAYLHQNDFTNVHVLDISHPPLDKFKKNYPSFPQNHIHQANFFDFGGQFDMIIEQTFYCAIPPIKRDEYVHKMYSLLKNKAHLVGLLFDFPLTNEGPPYGGSKKEYQRRFQDYFNFQKLEQAYNSHPKRQGKELFINFQKK